MHQMHMMFEHKLSQIEESNQKQINSFIEDHSRREPQPQAIVSVKATPPRPPLPHSTHKQVSDS